MKEGKKQPRKRLDLIPDNIDEKVHVGCGGELIWLETVQSEVKPVGTELWSESYKILFCTKCGTEVKHMQRFHNEIPYPSKGKYMDRSNLSGR